MENEEHIRILEQGLYFWTRWREKNPHIKPELRNANLRGANLRMMDLHEANLHGADLRRADLREANLIEANFGWPPFGEVTHEYESLDEPTFIKTDLPFRTDLSEANLSQTKLLRANLREVNLSGADLRGAYLSQADLSQADLSQADLSQAILKYTNFGNINLSQTQGLETVKHYGPSYIDLHTIYKSKGNIPEVFLRGVGAPENFITYMKSLTGAALDFYSCFISYSTKDQAFTERLYADLQAKDVRCWYAPEDLKIGEPLLSGIDRGIQLRDKLLLILSEHSVASRWVEHEVEVALYEELQPDRKTKVLFPIRLDNAVMETNVDWACRIRQTRNIGDFTHWKDHDAYQKAFERLLRDLKAEG